MTRIKLLTTVFVALMPTLAFAETSELVTLSQDEALTWTRHLIPLPKQVEITAKYTVGGNKVATQLIGTDAPLAQQAYKEIRTAIHVSETLPQPDMPLFTIAFQLGGPEAESLKKLKNADQAYRIIPNREPRQLRLIALSDRGLYYAGKTLQQLIYAKNPTWQVEMPMVSVTDWPDMEDRGLWGSDSSRHLQWMSDRKMNYEEQISGTRIDKNKKCYVIYPPYKQKMIDEGPTYGINPVPVILHLEQLKRSRIFDAYPEFQGKDATEGILCFSNPKFTDILSQWLVLWGKTPGVKEVDVWMTENMANKKDCQCDACKKHEPRVLEAKVILKAYDKAKQQLPNLGLRILTSEATENSNPEIIELLPPNVKLWYYHSLLTYNTSHRPMISDYLVEAIRKGRWIGVCPNISAVIGFWSPMTSPQFIHTRMNEFVDKKLGGFLGYATPELRYTLFNVEAAAEWSWNAKGRSPHEFALSYAVRQGAKEPKLIAEWCDTLGEVSWDLYGSDWPSGERRRNPGPVAKRLKKGTLPELGYILWGKFASPWGDIKSPQQLNDDVARADRALELARQIDVPELIQESLVIQGYIKSLKALWELRAIVKPDGVAQKNRDAAQRYFQMYVDSLRQSATALPAWEETLPKMKTYDRQMRKSIELINRSIDQMIEVAGELGFKIDQP